MKTIRWKITALILFSMTIIATLFIFNTYTDEKLQNFEKDINYLTDFNYHLQNAVICEKTYVNDHTQKTKESMNDCLSKAGERLRLLEQSTYFEREHINTLTTCLTNYRNKFNSLTEITEKVDHVNGIINDNLYSFTKKATDLIEKADEAVSNSFMNGDDIDPGIQILSDITRNIIVATNAIPLTLSRDLFLNNDPEKYASECQVIFKKLAVIHTNYKTAISRMTTTDEYYSEFFKKLTEVKTMLSARSEEIGHVWPEKVSLQSQLESVREQTLQTREAVLQNGRETVNRFQRNMFRIKVISFTLVLIILIIGGILTMRSITFSINEITLSLEESSDRLTEISDQVSLSSRELADGSLAQSESIRKTSSSLEQIFSMTKLNADNATKAAELIKNSGNVIDQADKIMMELNDSMNHIAQSSQEITDIIKTIDSIAFQTNLLALNASVEAARAGEAGAGFSVVASEVRNLAIRSSDSAKKTEAIVMETLKNVHQGNDLVAKSNDAIKAIVGDSEKIDALASEISDAARENSMGLDLITRSVDEIDRVTRNNSTAAEQSAKAADAMKHQAGIMGDLIARLTAISGHRKLKRHKEDKRNHEKTVNTKLLLSGEPDHLAP